MPANDREVWQYLTSDDTASLPVDYLTYAIFTHEKHEWIKHHHDRTGNEPSQAEVDNWIANLPEHQFQRMIETAVNFFDNAAREYLSEEMSAADDNAVRSAIVSEVKAASSFWRQLFMALFTAVLAPLILGGIIAAALIYNDRMPTPADISDRLR